jgi:hypothetical protein
MFVLHYQLLSPKAQMASQTQVAVECDLGDADREKEALPKPSTALWTMESLWISVPTERRGQ